jgi:hypothetical protein
MTQGSRAKSRAATLGYIVEPRWGSKDKSSEIPSRRSSEPSAAVPVNPGQSIVTELLAFALTGLLATALIEQNSKA